MASAGIGSPQHVAGELFKMMTGVDMQHVPYRGVAPALSDLIGGQVQVMFDTLNSSIEHIKVGKDTGAWSHHGVPLWSSAGYPANRRVRAGIRGRRVGRGSARQRVRRQRLSRRSTARSMQASLTQSKGPFRGPRGHGAASVTRRIRSADRRGRRKVGQGDRVRRTQGALTRDSQH